MPEYIVLPCSKALMYQMENGWSSETWNLTVKLFLSLHTYLGMSKSQIQDKEKDLKRDYRMLKESRMQSGVGWDPVQATG